MNTFLSIYLPLFVTGFIILVFIVPSVRVYKQTGINPLRFITKTHKAHDYVGASIKVFIAMIFLVVFIYSLSEYSYQFLAPFNYLENETLKIVGLFLGHLSIIGIMTAQYHMRKSWRIGIDYENRTPLVTKGFFKFLRNPIYLFLLIALFGLFLILPNAITFAVLFSAYLILHVTIRLEEEFLLKQHGEAYKEYQSKVPRLL